MNEKLKRQLLKVSRNIESRTQAEKLFLLGIVAAMISMAYLTYVYDPLRGDITNSRNQIASVKTQIELQQTSFAAKLAESREDPDKFASDRLAAIAEQQQALFDEIASLAGNLITPNQMTAILSSVLGRQSGLELISFQNEEAVPLRSVAQVAEAGADILQQNTAGQVFEHGLTIEFEGDFFNTLSYLSFLEEISGSFFWDSVTFEQIEWPNALITLKIHTLSTEEGFIGV